MLSHRQFSDTHSDYAVAQRPLTRLTSPAVQHGGQRTRLALPSGLGTGAGVTLGSVFRSDDAVEVDADPSTALLSRREGPHRELIRTAQVRLPRSGHVTGDMARRPIRLRSPYRTLTERSATANMPVKVWRCSGAEACGPNPQPERAIDRRYRVPHASTWGVGNAVSTGRSSTNRSWATPSRSRSWIGPQSRRCKLVDDT